MKKVLFVLFTAAIIYSCQNDDDSNSDVELIGNWRLIEVLADPGDGSGTFYPVESKKVITFKTDGTITSNGNLCEMSISSDHQTSGTYSKSESTYNSSACNNPAYNFTFEKNNNQLIVYYPCIEACQAKYIKQ